MGALVSRVSGFLLAAVVASLARLNDRETNYLAGLAGTEVLLGLVIVIILAVRALVLWLGVLEPGPPPEWVHWLLGW